MPASCGWPASATSGTRPRRLEELREKTAEAGAELESAISAAHAASLSFVAWLEEQAPSKTGPSGIGKDNYTWYLQNVHLVPLTWEDEVRLLKRELDRAHASLRLEEHRNRDLPALVAISSPEEYDRRANEAVTKYLAFLETKTSCRSATTWIRPCARASAASCPRRSATSSAPPSTSSR